MFRQDVVLVMLGCLLFSGCATVRDQARVSDNRFLTLLSLEKISVRSENEEDEKPPYRQIKERIFLEEQTRTLAEVLANPTVNSKLVTILTEQSPDPVVPAVEIRNGLKSDVIAIELLGQGLGKLNVPTSSVIQLLNNEQWQRAPFLGFEVDTNGKELEHHAGGQVVVSGLVKRQGELALVRSAGAAELRDNNSIKAIAKKTKTAEGLAPDVVVVTRIRQNRIYRYFFPLPDDVESDNIFSGRLVQNGDRLHFTKVDLLPEVVAGKAAVRMRARMAENTQNKPARSPFRIFRR